MSTFEIKKDEPSQHLPDFLEYCEEEINPEPSFSESAIFNNKSKTEKAEGDVEGYHFLCKNCKEFPKISFVKKKIAFDCGCKHSPKEYFIKDIFDKYLYFGEEKNIQQKLNCPEHVYEKLTYYCKSCKKSICQKCLREKCIFQHQEKVKLLADKNIIEKANYIKKYVKEIIKAIVILSNPIVGR